MASESQRLRDALAASRKTVDEVQLSVLKVESSLTELEDREQRREARSNVAVSDVAERFPAIGGNS